MRLLVVVVLFAIAGGSLGVARTWSEFANIEERMKLPGTVQVGGDVGETGVSASVGTAHSDGTPLAKVDGELSHDFGVLKPEASKSHTFVVRNEGDSDLLIQRDNVSCGRCVQTTFTSATLRPGESLEIPVTLTAQKPGPKLNENLEVRTNDETHEVIRFDLIAYVSDDAGASVSTLALGTIVTDKGASSSFRVYGFTDDPLEMVECKLRSGDNRDSFEFEVTDLTTEEAQAGQSYAKSGKRINVSVKPGLPVGPLKQEITIVARCGSEVIISVPVSGRVTGDLSLIGGSKFRPSNSILSMGRLLAGEGGSAKLHLMVKGKHREEVELTVGACDPAGVLSATVGERKAIQNGKAYLYPITVTVAKDAPVMNRLGGVVWSAGKINLETTHPTAKAVTLHVRFAVE